MVAQVRFWVWNHMQGQLMQQIASSTFPTGSHELKLDLNSLSKGVYNFQLSINGQASSQRSRRQKDSWSFHLLPLYSVY